MLNNILNKIVGLIVIAFAFLIGHYLMLLFPYVMDGTQVLIQANPSWETALLAAPVLLFMALVIGFVYLCISGIGLIIYNKPQSYNPVAPYPDITINPVDGYAYGYKLTNKKGYGPDAGSNSSLLGMGRKGKKVNYVTDTICDAGVIDRDPTNCCSYGINLYTLKGALHPFRQRRIWKFKLNFSTPKNYRLFMVKFPAKDAVFLLQHKSIFRVQKCERVAEIDLARLVADSKTFDGDIKPYLLAEK